MGLLRGADGPVDRLAGRGGAREPVQAVGVEERGRGRGRPGGGARRGPAELREPVHGAQRGRAPIDGAHAFVARLDISLAARHVGGRVAELPHARHAAARPPSSQGERRLPAGPCPRPGQGGARPSAATARREAHPVARLEPGPGFPAPAPRPSPSHRVDRGEARLPPAAPRQLPEPDVHGARLVAHVQAGRDRREEEGAEKNKGGLDGVRGQRGGGQRGEFRPGSRGLVDREQGAPSPGRWDGRRRWGRRAQRQAGQEEAQEVRRVHRVPEEGQLRGLRPVPERQEPSDLQDEAVREAHREEGKRLVVLSTFSPISFVILAKHSFLRLKEFTRLLYIYISRI